MTFFMVIVPLSLFGAVVGLLVFRNLGRVWLDHRVKMLLLAKLEKKPELLQALEEVEDLVDGSGGEDEPGGSQDLLLTGVILAVLGIIFAVSSHYISGGSWVVGMYFGGVGCVAVGFFLALLGLLVRFLARNPLDEGKK